MNTVKVKNSTPFSLTPALSRWERGLLYSSPQRGEVGRGRFSTAHDNEPLPFYAIK
jgi:hypothetical protein